MDPPTSLSRYLDGEYWQVKEKLRRYFVDNELFKLRFDLYLPEARSVSTKRAMYLFQVPEVQQQFDMQAQQDRGFINRSLAMGEVFAATDVSVTIKMGVMAWLFGGAVISLGTDEQIKKWFLPLKDLKFSGMFCMSEKGHGSNVRQIETEAHYDVHTKEFIINTPSEDASKMYIGNSLGGEFAAVFAQLYLDGQCKGPHCFIVPVRENGYTLGGVNVIDLGLKEGLNGVDNGMLSFTNVRIPRENMLNKFASVSPDGVYSSSIPNNGARFNAMLSALIPTRVALCFQALASLKIGLEIAVKYSLQRRQFGPNNGEPECIILDYQTHQQRLMPYIASSLGLMFTTRYAGELLDLAKLRDEDVTTNRPLQALCSGLKAYCTWEAVQGLQACRECVGGMGYFEENRISSLKRDADVFVTFEGDNMVMLQQVAKELLAQYSKQMGDSKLFAAFSVAKSNCMDSLKTSRWAFSFQPVTNINYVIQALQFKEDRLLRKLGARLLNKVSSGTVPFDAWNDCLSHTNALAWCYIKKVTLIQFQEAVERCPYDEDKRVLDVFCRLYAVNLLYSDRAWFLEHNYISSVMTSELREEFYKLCKEARQCAGQVVQAFRHPDVCVHAPIAGIPNNRSPWAYYPNPLTKAKL